jgi:ABC-type polysaccharide/polyol phosphate transport system ATPase subunit
MEGYRNSGTTIRVVAHQMDTIKSMCNRVAWIEHGSVRDLGSAEK